MSVYNTQSVYSGKPYLPSFISTLKGDFMDVLRMMPEDVKKAFKEGEINVAVFGLGKMGLPLAAVFAEKGAKVIGVDINEGVVSIINSGKSHIQGEPGLEELVKKNVENGRLRATTDGIRASQDADIMVILVPTMIDDLGVVNLGPVMDSAEKISKGLEKGNIVITEATMPPGTTESLIPPLQKNGIKLGEFGLAHCPERTMSGTAIRDITGRYPKIIGADSEKTLSAVKAIYEIINSKGTIPLSSIKSAEAVKVFEGIYRDVNIALANELAIYCEEQGLDAIEVFEAANTQPYCHLHKPGAGVGGHCIPVYPWFVIKQSKRDTILLRAAREINDSMPQHMVELTRRALRDANRGMKGSNILILGLTFRGDVYEFRKSPSISYIKLLNETGAIPYVYDPVCTEKDAVRFGARWFSGYRNMDAIVIMNDSHEFRSIDLEDIGKRMRTKIVVDGRNLLMREDARKFDFIYYGIGKGSKNII